MVGGGRDPGDSGPSPRGVVNLVLRRRVRAFPERSPPILLSVLATETTTRSTELQHCYPQCGVDRLWIDWGQWGQPSVPAHEIRGRSGWGLWMSGLGYPPGQWTASPGTLPAGLGNRLEDAQFWACRRGAPGRVGPYLSRPWANLGHRLGLRHTDFRGRPRQPLAAPRSRRGRASLSVE